MRIGLALGAGGANGLAHILMLEAFDELGIKPDYMAGSSIGAIIGALYASGHSAIDIKDIVDDLMIRDTDTWKEMLLEKNIFKWIEFLDPEIGKGGFISGDAFLGFLVKAMKITQFEDLTIPFKVITTDFWKREQVIFDSGDLVPAIKGSMAIPGLFTPVQYDGRVLVDGGAVNPVPYDTLFDDCDITVAIDVSGRKSPKKNLSFLDSVFNSFQIMQHSILKEKMARRHPDIYIQLGLYDVRALEFFKLDEIYKLALPAKEELKRRLDEICSA